MRVEVKATTPLCFGDVIGHRNVTGPRPSSIIGSLRYWFTVICSSCGILEGKNDAFDVDQYKKDVLKIISEEGNMHIEAIKIKAAAKQLDLPSLLFGCTEWKSLVQINRIYNIDKNVNWDLERVLEIADADSGRTSKWYLNYSKIKGFSIEFDVNPLIQNDVFLPLLSFIEMYGYIGSKNNVGFGRVRFEGIHKNPEFNFSLFGYGRVRMKDILYETKEFDHLITSDKIVFYRVGSKEDLECAIHQLIKNKALKRKEMKKEEIDNTKKRHELFGYKRINKVPSQGTKIIPWIHPNNGIYETGFVSVAFLNKKEVTNNETK